MRKQAIGTATIPAAGGAGKFAGLAALALTRKAWSEDRGRAPNANQGDIVRKQGAEIAIGDLRDRASLDAARKDVDAVFYIEPAFLANEAEIGKSMVDGAKLAGMRRRAILPLMKGRGWGRIAGEYGVTVDVLTRGLTVTPSTKKIFPSEDRTINPTSNGDVPSGPTAARSKSRAPATRSTPLARRRVAALIEEAASKTR
jgi:hypothetical protein